jgi:serine/threonine protein phosphatase 1
VVAVGDIHGRLDLLDSLLDQILEEIVGVDGAIRPMLIFVGDYVDRGPASKGVIDRIIDLGRRPDLEVQALKGNHEEALLAFLEDPGFGVMWCEQGGAQTLASYGVAAPRLASDDKGWEAARAAFDRALPIEHKKFLATLDLTATVGDYVFVHAGLRPGVPLAAQSEHDLLWIRQDFLYAPGPFEKVVVHGHTPETEPFLGLLRIGIDTGAYATGVLTAVVLRGTERSLMQSRLARAD